MSRALSRVLGGTIIILVIVLVVLICCKFHLRELFVPNKVNPYLDSLKRDLAALHPDVAKLDMFEDDKSYTVNKKKVYICMRDENGQYYEKNHLIYVICHELAHVLCKSVGHTDEFLNIFKDLLNKAEALGVYDPKIPMIKNYCGVKME